MLFAFFFLAGLSEDDDSRLKDSSGFISMPFLVADFKHVVFYGRLVRKCNEILLLILDEACRGNGGDLRMAAAQETSYDTLNLEISLI